MKATLEEIEADVQRVRGRVSPMQDATWTALKSILGLVAHDGERITALEAKVAALAGPVIPVDLSEIHAELDRLRADNAELREKLAKTAEALDNTRQTSFSTTQKLREENAELRKRVEQQRWPDQQPIETAPLGRILTWCADDGPEAEWLSESPDDHTLEEWRASLKKWGRTSWLPMPPPGGGK